MDSVDLQSVTLTLEEAMSIASVTDYQRMMRSENIWWPALARPRDVASRKETIHWILDTAKIEVKDFGQVTFEDMTTVDMLVEPQFGSAGLEIGIEAFQDLRNGRWGGEAIDSGTAWARQMGAQMAYWPQYRMARSLLANPVCYDTLAFFHHSHQVNPGDASSPTYANLLDATSLGTLSPIDETVTVDVAVKNLNRAIAYIRSLKSPNARDPRFLQPVGILVPTAMTARIQQLTNARFIAQAASSGGGSGDITGVIRNLGLGDPLIAPEIGAGYTYDGYSGSDVDYYIVCETADVEIGPFVYARREAWNIVYHDLQSSAELARRGKLQWVCRGRNEIVPALPYTIFKVKGS
jgi:hypothetical protein